MNWRHIVSVLVFAALYVLWAIPLRSALNFHEQFQLFLFDWDYFFEHLFREAGLAVWLSEALVQFYNNYWLGAAILSGELILIQWLSWKVLGRMFGPTARKMSGRGGNWLLFCLSFLPMIVVGVAIGDVNTMHSLLIAVNEALTMLYVLTAVLTTQRMRCSVRRVLFALLLPLFAVIFFWTAGTNHYRSTTQNFSLDNVYDRDSYDLLHYDLMVRANDWDGIIAKAESRQPETAMDLSAMNLALAMNGELGRRIGDFHQYGTAGLIPPFTRESFSLLTTAEIYFQLGLVNTAQRFYFEAMEGLPNCKKSCRCIRRLAETNLINGQYDVARKYLRLLKKTVFYRLWATKTLNLIDRGEEAIEQHPLYGKLRRYRLTDDFLFFEQEVDMICGRLFLQDRNNALALQYMLAHPLLGNDAGKFVKYMQVADECLSFSTQLEGFRKYLPKQ